MLSHWVVILLLSPLLSDWVVILLLSLLLSHGVVILLLAPYFLVPFLVITIRNHHQNQDIGRHRTDEIKPEQDSVNHRRYLLPLRHNQLPLIQRRTSPTHFRYFWPWSVFLGFPVFSCVVIVPGPLCAWHLTVCMLQLLTLTDSFLQRLVFLSFLINRSRWRTFFCLACFSSVPDELIFQREGFQFLVKQVVLLLRWKWMFPTGIRSFPFIVL